MPSLVKILVRDFTPEEKKRVSEAAKGRKESLQKFTKRAILREAGVDTSPDPLPADVPEK